MKAQDSLVRGFGLLQATALNMSNMVGVGPFITIPLIIAAMGGPQCMLGWLLGAVLALCDGLVWSELAAAMPGTGGTYHYLSEVFRKTRLGGLLPFLFIWQFIFSGPLEIASGYIGFAQYVGYFWRGMGPGGARMVSAARRPAGDRAALPPHHRGRQADRGALDRHAGHGAVDDRRRAHAFPRRAWRSISRPAPSPSAAGSWPAWAPPCSSRCTISWATTTSATSAAKCAIRRA